MTDHRRPADARTLAVTAGWRLLIVACGLIGVIGAVQGRELAGALSELSQQASLATAAIYLGLLAYPFVTGRRFHEPRTPWWRGALAVTLIVVMVVYAALLDTDYSTTHSQFEHVITPVLVTVDLLVVGRNLLNVTWWSVLGWLAFPLAYLVYYNVADLDAYDIPLKVGDGDFFVYFPVLLVATLLVAAVLVGVGRARARSGGQQLAQHPAEQQPS